MRHSWPGGSAGKSLDLPKRQETIVVGYVRRGDSCSVYPQKVEHHLSELQRWVQTAAISSHPRDGHEPLMLQPLPPRILCASAGHYPHPLPGTSAAHHCQGSVIQGKFLGGNTRCTSGCCNVMPASGAAGLPHILYPSLPRPE